MNMTDTESIGWGPAAPPSPDELPEVSVRRPIQEMTAEQSLEWLHTLHRLGNDAAQAGEETIATAFQLAHDLVAIRRADEGFDEE
jgi:hypothetical protein